MTRLRAGLAGCGARGELSAALMAGQADCGLAAVFDPEAKARDRLAERFGIGLRCGSFDELLATGIDFVVLAAPPDLRRQQVQAAAYQGVHCLLHAPMSLTVADARAMTAHCERAGVKLGVLVPDQGDPVLDEVRRMIAEDFLGATTLIHGTLGHDRLGRVPRADGGGAVLQQLAAEHLHLAVWLSGRDAVAVTAQSGSGLASGRQDSAVATATLRGGGLCTLAVSHCGAARVLTIHGTDGHLALVGECIALRGKRPWPGPLLEYPRPGEELVLDRRNLGPALAGPQGETELHGRFARWIDELDGFPCPSEQALRDMHALAAMVKAAVSGRREDVDHTGD